MPWESILTELMEQCLETHPEGLSLPRSPQALRCIVKVFLRVDKKSMDPILRQLTVRPYVLIQLLRFLWDHNHEVFRKKGARSHVWKLLEKRVHEYYPVRAEDVALPAEEQRSDLPPDLCELDASMRHGGQTLRRRLIPHKNATPGEGAKSSEDCLWNTRPSSVSPGVSAASFTDPGTTRTDAVTRQGSLTVQTGGTLISQWEGKYLSQVLPFVMTFMVSGPDYMFYNNAARWRRNDKAGFPQAP